MLPKDNYENFQDNGYRSYPIKFRELAQTTVENGSKETQNRLGLYFSELNPNWRWESGKHELTLKAGKHELHVPAQGLGCLAMMRFVNIYTS